MSIPPSTRSARLSLAFPALGHVYSHLFAPIFCVVRGVPVLAVTLLCAGLIYQATQPGLPKVFSERLGDVAGGGVLGVSAFVALVYLVAGAWLLPSERRSPSAVAAE